jgi:protein ImuA
MFAPLVNASPASWPAPLSAAPALGEREARLLEQQVWRASSLGASSSPCLSSGFAALDAELPGGGWPTHSLSEILCPPGLHLEWRLLLPALRGLLAEPRIQAATSRGRGRARKPSAPRAQQQRPLLLINPPLIPHLPGLQAAGLAPQQLIWLAPETPQQQLWAAEQAIKSNAAAALLLWLPKLRPEQLRRLQTQALGLDAPLFLFRPEAAAAQSSAAPLRLQLDLALGARSPQQELASLQLRILKRRGPAFEGLLQLPALPSGLDRVLTATMLARGLGRPTPAPHNPPVLQPPRPAAPSRHALARPAQPARAAG